MEIDYNTRDVLGRSWLQLWWGRVKGHAQLRLDVTCSIQYLWMDQMNGNSKLKKTNTKNKNKDMTHLSLCTSLLITLNNILGAYSNSHMPATTYFHLTVITQILNQGQRVIGATTKHARRLKPAQSLQKIRGAFLGFLLSKHSQISHILKFSDIWWTWGDMLNTVLWIVQK